MKKYILPILVCLIFTGLFSYQSFHKLVVPDKANLDFKKHLLKQPDHITCGPTSATMVLHYYSKSITLNEVKKLTYTEWIKFANGTNFGMTAPDSIRHALHRSGVPASVCRGNVYKIKKAIFEGKPVIVLLRSSKETWHYCVVISYNNEGFILADPSYGTTIFINKQQFMDSWKFTHNMHGEKCGYECAICQGTGKYFQTLQCDACAGKGTLDPIILGLRAMEVYSNSMIVPK